MDCTFSALASRAVATEAAEASCCPTKDLLALTHSNATLALYRTSAQAEPVWEYSKGKGKQKDEIDCVAWNPTGTHLALASTSTLTLLAIESGQPSLPAQQLPSDAGSITRIVSLPLPLSRSVLESATISFLNRLPTLPPLSSAGTKPSTSTAASGVFGSAKNALLLKEREKEAGRKLEIPQNFPTLLPRTAETDADREGELLLLSTESGQLRFYLGGTIYIGSHQLPPSTSLLGASLHPDPAPPHPSTSTSTTTQLSLLVFSTTTHTIASLPLSNQLPPTWSLLAEQVTLVRSLLHAAFESFQEARGLWEESRRIGKAWVGRLNELSKANKVTTPPVTQLLLLLLAGRTGPTLQDFLSSKMNERALAKWESATNSSFEKFKQFAGLGVGGLGIMLERIVLALDEMRAWAQWPEKFAVFALEAKVLRTAVTLIAEILKRVTQVEKFILEEESRFASFTRWVRYEIEKMTMAEGAETRPTARFQPLPVSQYLQNSLVTSPIIPFLDFGLGTTALESNLAVAQVEQWFDTKSGRSSVGGVEVRLEGDGMKEESLGAVMRRMKEELRGQADAALIAPPSTTAPLSSAERPKRVDASTYVDEDSPTPSPNTSFGASSHTGKLGVDSIPVLLHVLTRRLAGTFSQSLERLGEGIIAGVGVELGTLSNPEGGAAKDVRVRERLVDGVLFYAWVDKSILTIARLNVQSTEVQRTTMNLRLPSKEGVFEMIDFDFFDNIEIVATVKSTPIRGAAEYFLVTIPYIDLPHQATSSTLIPQPHLPISRKHTLDPRFPPQFLALNGRAGRRTACVIGGEGRKLDVLDLDDVGLDEEGEEDESMQVGGEDAGGVEMEQ